MNKFNAFSRLRNPVLVLCVLPFLTACPKTSESGNIPNTVVLNPNPGNSPTATPNPAPSSTPAPISSFSPTPTLVPNNTPTPTPVQISTPTPMPISTPTPTPVQISTPTPTPVPNSTPTPTPIAGVRELILGPSKDARLMQAANHINQNTGAEFMMWFKSGNGIDRSIIAFDLSSIGVTADKIVSAELVLTIDPKYTREAIDNGGVNVGLYRTISGWIEGNGITDGYYEGASINPTGLAVTWRCIAREFGLTSSISDDSDCNLPWNGGDIDLTKPVSTYHHNIGDTTNRFELTLEISTAVSQGVSEISWVITKTEEVHAGKNSYFTKEGASYFGKPEIAPALKIKIRD